MPRFNWLYVAAVGGWLAVLCPVSAQDNKPVGQSTNQQTEDQRKSPDDDDKAAAWWEGRKGSPDEYRAICQSPRNKEHADLCQQWRTAEAAEKQAEIAVWQLVASAAGVIGLIATIFYTHRTYRLSANATEQELRPYVFVETLTIGDNALSLEGTHTIADQRGRIGVVVHIKNTGQTPAARLVHWSDIACVAPADEASLVVPLPLRQEFATNAPVNGIIIKSFEKRVRLTADEMRAVDERRNGLYVYGRIEYWDAFRKLRFTNYRLVYWGIYPPPDGNLTFTFCPGGNETDQTNPQKNWAERAWGCIWNKP